MRHNLCGVGKINCNNGDAYIGRPPAKHFIIGHQLMRVSVFVHLTQSMHRFLINVMLNASEVDEVLQIGKDDG